MDKRRLDSRASKASASLGATVSKFTGINVDVVNLLFSGQQKGSTTKSNQAQLSKHSKIQLSTPRTERGNRSQRGQFCGMSLGARLMLKAALTASVM